MSCFLPSHPLPSRVSPANSSDIPMIIAIHLGTLPLSSLSSFYCVHLSSRNDIKVSNVSCGIELVSPSSVSPLSLQGMLYFPPSHPPNFHPPTFSCTCSLSFHIIIHIHLFRRSHHVHADHPCPSLFNIPLPSYH